MDDLVRPPKELENTSITKTLVRYREIPIRILKRLNESTDVYIGMPWTLSLVITSGKDQSVYVDPPPALLCSLPEEKLHGQEKYQNFKIISLNVTKLNSVFFY